MNRHLPPGCVAVPIEAIDSAMNRLGMIVAACSAELPAEGDGCSKAIMDRARAGVWAETALYQLKLHRNAAGIDPYEEPAIAPRVQS